MAIKDWEQFERAVADFVAALAPGATVTHNVMLPDRDTGKPRQRDVWVEATVGMFPVKILVSCKNLKRKINQGDLDAFAGELRSSGAHKGVLYAYSGFTEPALKKAKSLGFSCCKLYRGEPAELPESLLLVFYCCYDSFRVGLNPEGLEHFGDATFKEVFAVRDDTAEPPATLLDKLVRDFGKRQTEELDKAAREGRFPKSWGITVELAASSKEPPSLMITLEGKWRVYKARLEGHLLNGTYSFTEDRFSGSQISPWVDLRGEEPGPLWELVPEPPAEIPPGVGILFRHGGDLRQSLIDHFAERKVRELT